MELWLICTSGMRSIARSAALTFTFLIAAASAHAGQVDRLYIIDCGWAHAVDQSLWSPGANVGTDRIAALPSGQYVPPLRETWHRRQTLLASLADLGVKPAGIHYVAISHIHPDHIGNVDEFPDATVIIQKAEWEYAMTLPQKPFSPEHKAQLIEGDKDLFSDGSVVFLFTPGHTPGHQSLLVRLPKTGTVLLSGDAVHFKDNWDNRRVPALNADKDQTLASMQRIADSLAREQANLWINHDKPSSDARRYAPEFYE